MRSLPDNQGFTRSLGPAARTATANGAGVQTGANADARAFLLDVGLWTDGTHVFSFQSSPDGSTWTALVADELDDPAGILDSGAATVTVDGAGDDDVFHQLGALTTVEYLRAVQTVTASPSTGLVSAVNVQHGHPLRFAGDNNPMKADGVSW